jgi:hypothetical protein
MRKNLLALFGALSSALVLAIPTIAQPSAGFILFGNSRDIAMDYCLDRGSADQIDTYYLEIKTQKFKYAEVIVSYPPEFNPDFSGMQVELFQTNDCRGGKPIPIESAQLDQERRRIVVVPKQAIPAGTPVRLVLSSVRNPRFSGIYQIDARLLRADVPAPVYIGSWIVSIE